jgi:hypothetical protein
VRDEQHRSEAAEDGRVGAKGLSRRSLVHGEKGTRVRTLSFPPSSR